MNEPKHNCIGPAGASALACVLNGPTPFPANMGTEVVESLAAAMAEVKTRVAFGLNVVEGFIERPLTPEERRKLSGELAARIIARIKAAK